jgi:hypothetical protein
MPDSEAVRPFCTDAVRVIAICILSRRLIVIFIWKSSGMICAKPFLYVRMDTHISGYRTNRRCSGLYWNRRGGSGDRAHSLRDFPHFVSGNINPSPDEWVKTNK